MLPTYEICWQAFLSEINDEMSTFSPGRATIGVRATIKPDGRLEGCMAMMAECGLRHLPSPDAGKIVSVISIGDVGAFGDGRSQGKPDLMS